MSQAMGKLGTWLGLMPNFLWVVRREGEIFVVTINHSGAPSECYRLVKCESSAPFASGLPASGGTEDFIYEITDLELESAV